MKNPSGWYTKAYDYRGHFMALHRRKLHFFDNNRGESICGRAKMSTREGYHRIEAHSGMKRCASCERMINR